MIKSDFVTGSANLYSSEGCLDIAYTRKKRQRMLLNLRKSTWVLLFCALTWPLGLQGLARWMHATINRYSTWNCLSLVRANGCALLLSLGIFTHFWRPFAQSVRCVDQGKTMGAGQQGAHAAEGAGLGCKTTKAHGLGAAGADTRSSSTK